MEAMTLSNLIDTLKKLMDEAGDIQVFSVIPNGFDENGNIAVHYDLPDVITNGEFALLSTKAVCEEIVSGSNKAADEAEALNTEQTEEISPLDIPNTSNEDNNPLA